MTPNIRLVILLVPAARHLDLRAVLGLFMPFEVGWRRKDPEIAAGLCAL